MPCGWRPCKRGRPRNPFWSPSWTVQALLSGPEGIFGPGRMTPEIFGASLPSIIRRPHLARPPGRPLSTFVLRLLTAGPGEGRGRPVAPGAYQRHTSGLITSTSASPCVSKSPRTRKTLTPGSVFTVGLPIFQDLTKQSLFRLPELFDDRRPVELQFSTKFGRGHLSWDIVVSPIACDNAFDVVRTESLETQD